jgi:hypothetical protein
LAGGAMNSKLRKFFLEEKQLAEYNENFYPNLTPRERRNIKKRRERVRQLLRRESLENFIHGTTESTKRD